MCENCIHRHKTRWNIIKKDPNTWLKKEYLDQIGPVESPSTLQDIFEIEKRRKQWKFHLFEINSDLIRYTQQVFFQ